MIYRRNPMIRQHAPLSYSRLELVQLINSSIFTAVILFLFAWRVTDLVLLSGLGFFLGYVVITYCSLIVFSGTAKILGYRRGFFVTYQRWKSGQIFGIIFSILSTGFVPFMFPGNNDIEANLRVRSGKVFPGENKKDISVIGFSAVIGLLIFSIMLRLLANSIGGTFLHFAAMGPAIMAILTLLPLPKSQGGPIFYVNKKNYTTTAIILGIIAIMILTNTVLYVLLALLLLAILIFGIRRLKRI